MSPLTLPGLIDVHVHFREPGLEHKATMASEAASALAGGVTTVCEMPNTLPPTVTVAALADKVRRAADLPIDLRFYFGLTEAIHLSTLRELWNSTAEEMARLRARCCGVKLYLDHSTGDQKVAEELLDDIFHAAAEHDIQLVAHCEDPAVNAAALAAHPGPDIAAHALRRPPEAEAVSIAAAIALAKKHGSRLHVAHLSTAQGVVLVKQAKAEGLPVTCEVSPHHLFLTVDDFASLGTLAKMNPPLRTAEHRDALWAGIAEGTVDCVATDHAPHTLEEKQAGEPLKAPSGVPGVETMLPLLLSIAGGHWPHPSAARPAAARLAYDDIARLCFANPNRIFRLGKKTPEEGGDRVEIDTEAEWVIRGKELHSKCGWTPFEGWNVKGKIVRVACRP